jgi:hypothetical protein
MATSLVHRGPDDAGYLEDGPCGFGFRRLSVIDLVTGKQPILSEDGARAIILNGEIYNYTELRSALRDAGRRFLTNSDTEVVLAAYEQHGAECRRCCTGCSRSPSGIAIVDASSSPVTAWCEAVVLPRRVRPVAGRRADERSCFPEADRLRATPRLPTRRLASASAPREDRPHEHRRRAGSGILQRHVGRNRRALSASLS